MVSLQMPADLGKAIQHTLIHRSLTPEMAQVHWFAFGLLIPWNVTLWVIGYDICDIHDCIGVSPLDNYTSDEASDKLIDPQPS